MHLWAIFTVTIFAWALRHKSVSTDASWAERWYKNLFLLLFPGLSILSTAIAILYMGCHGAMLGVQAGSWGCSVAASLLVFALVCLIKLIHQSRRTVENLKNYPQQKIGETTAKIIDINLPYSAQIGFWQPQLAITSGLLNALDRDRLQAVIAHEQAHLHYRDTFWFFWFGWIRTFTFWMPNTEALWCELLLLRELRADSKAAETVDFLLLAESLLIVAKAPLTHSSAWCANFNERAIGDRLNERISYLLERETPLETHQWHNWCWLSLLFLPLLTIPLHY